MAIRASFMIPLLGALLYIPLLGPLSYASRASGHNRGRNCRHGRLDRSLAERTTVIRVVNGSGSFAPPTVKYSNGPSTNDVRRGEFVNVDWLLKREPMRGAHRYRRQSARRECAADEAEEAEMTTLPTRLIEAEALKHAKDCVRL